MNINKEGVTIESNKLYTQLTKILIQTTINKLLFFRFVLQRWCGSIFMYVWNEKLATKKN